MRDIADFNSRTDTTTVVNHITYGVYGVITAETNSSIKHAFAFTGRERDYESGLHHYRERYYAGSSGVFLTEDPIGFTARDTKLDRYGSNDPVNVVDRNGLWEQPVELLWAPSVITPGPVHPGGLGFNPQLPNGDSFWSWMGPALWRLCVGAVNPMFMNGGTIGIEFGANAGLFVIPIASIGLEFGYNPSLGNDDITVGLGPTLGLGAGPYGGYSLGPTVTVTNAMSVSQLSGWGNQACANAGPFAPGGSYLWGTDYAGASIGTPSGSFGVFSGATYTWLGWYSFNTGLHAPTWIPPINYGDTGPINSIPQHQILNQRF
jgi:RHS repeat-associated protein